MSDTGNIYAFSAPLLDGRELKLDTFKGQAVLIVNTASECGFTPQYAGLEWLYQTYKDRGFSVLGFPCDQFCKQEPGSSEQIHTFCQKNYGVTFPMFAKIEVNGPGAHALYQYLTRSKSGFLGRRRISWNFTKFLVGRDGKVLERFAPAKKPEKLAGSIEAGL